MIVVFGVGTSIFQWRAVRCGNCCCMQICKKLLLQCGWLLIVSSAWICIGLMHVMSCLRFCFSVGSNVTWIVHAHVFEYLLFLLFCLLVVFVLLLLLLLLLLLSVVVVLVLLVVLFWLFHVHCCANVLQSFQETLQSQMAKSPYTYQIFFPTLIKQHLHRSRCIMHWSSMFMHKSKIHSKSDQARHP